MAAKFIAALIPGLVLTAGTAAAQDRAAKAAERAEIPFVDTNIRSFTPARGGEGLYIQDRRKNWYYASFGARCHELPYAFNVGFKTFAGTLERGSTVIAGRERCMITDLVRSGPPPAKKKARKTA